MNKTRPRTDNKVERGLKGAASVADIDELSSDLLVRTRRLVVDQ
jgi:hypothetical protein